MINIYEVKSNRVKGICFHPTNTWILTTLHTGPILIYDYRHGILIDKFEEHEGPVRSAHFHAIQPFFVSGGDDCKIKVWNYNTKHCMFNLTGHTDYIRTVQFHNELSWILSASDDQTIRIWNWLNRTLLTTVTGHDHYVMSAFFHPSQDLIVSSSVDQTIRVWDYSTLKKKFSEARTNAYEVLTMDVTVKFKLEGHDKGVNWAVFHPTLPLIASASDDKNIKIWKYSDTKCTEADTLRGHFNNVSSVYFHPKLDILISDSEDKSIRIWDLEKHTNIEKITKENDRFWVVVGHPSLNIFACGSDSGLIVFKLESTRIPSASLSNNKVILYQNKEILQWKTDETDKKTISQAKFSSKSIRHGVKKILVNPFLPNNSNIYNFAVIFDDSVSKNVYFYNHKVEDCAKSNPQKLENYTGLCFISKDKCLSLISNELFISDINKINDRIPIKINAVDTSQIENIYQAHLGKFIAKFKSGVLAIIDVNSKKIIHELNEIVNLKNVVWNSTMTLAVLVGKSSVYLINKNFEVLTARKENSPIKSVCFDENGVLFYSTHFHIKYCLKDNLYGIIKSTKSTVYLLSVNSSTFFFSDSLQQMSSERFNYTEVKFKLALQNKNYDDIVGILKSGSIIGKKVSEDIQNAGFPDLSLKLVTDSKQKFNLCLESGKLEEAKEAADALGDKEYYYRLAEKAMQIGKSNIVEACYIKSNSFDKLMFYYAISGKRDKLQKLQAIFQSKNDNSRRFLNTIYTGDINDRIKLLAETGKVSLALLAAKIHHATDLEKYLVQNSKEITEKFNEEEFDKIYKSSTPLVPLKPVLLKESKDYNSYWFIFNELKKTNNEIMENNNLMNEIEKVEENPINDKINSIENQTNQPTEIPKKKPGKIKIEDDEEEEIEEVVEVKKEQTDKRSIDIQYLSTPSDDILKQQNENSLIPGVHLVLGNFQKCVNLLKTQIKLTNVDILKPIMKNIYLSGISQFGLIPCLPSHLMRLRDPRSTKKLVPSSSVRLSQIEQNLNKAFEIGINQEGLEIFREILRTAIFFIAANKQEENKIKEIIYTCTEYIYLIRMVQLKIQNKADKIKSCEISCLMTYCKLEQPLHYYIIYEKAKISCKNIKNYLTTLHFCKKMLSLEKELAGSEDVDFDKVKTEFVNCQNQGTNAHNLLFNTSENYANARSSIDARSLNLIKDKQVIKCGLCNSTYFPDAAGSICDTCQLTTLGGEFVGLRLSDEI